MRGPEMMQIHLEGMLFDGTDDPDAVFTIFEDGIRGLYDSLGVRRDRVVRPAAHGTFSLPGYRDARVLSWGGNLFTDTLSEQDRRLRQLAGILAEGGRSTLVAQTPSGSLSCEVELASEPDTRILVPGTIVEYEFHVRAPDPRLYGEIQSFAGSSLTVHHYGNFPAWPTVVVDGPRSAPYSVSGPEGRMVTVTQPLLSGQSHRIDFASGGLYLDGVRQQGKLLRFQPWSIPSGRVVPMSIDQGSMTVIVTDTYI